MKKTTSHAKGLIFFAACMFLLSSRPVHGQTDEPINAGLQFNFSSPGARSLGVGGAFLGLADDATAAFTNPAGLVQLSKPEVSAEGRRSSYTNQFTKGGTGNVGSVQALQTGTSKDDVTNLSFTSFVYPRRRWAIAAYRQELANFATTLASKAAFYVAPLGARLAPAEASLALRIVNVGVAGAVRVNDSLSIGAGLSDYQFNLHALNTRFQTGDDPGVGTIFDFESQAGHDHELAVNAGLLWKISPQWSAGGVFRQGPRFNFSTLTKQADVTIPSFTLHGTFHVPDVYGAGVSFRPADAWTLTADYDRVRYSQLAGHTVDTQNPPGLANPAVNQLVVDDANEVHLGIEYVMTRLKYPVAIRLGGWLDPDHRIRFQGTPPTPPIPTTSDLLTQQLFLDFRPGSDQVHVAGGIGLVISERFQLDAAYDHSRFVSIASLSGVWRF